MRIAEKTDGQILYEAIYPGASWSEVDAGTLAAWDFAGASRNANALIAVIRRQAEELQRAGETLRKMRAVLVDLDKCIIHDPGCPSERFDICSCGHKAREREAAIFAAATLPVLPCEEEG